MRIRNQRDFWAGVMFAAVGLLFIALSQQYQMGTAAKMGPGYFPTVLGGLMAVLGLMIGLDGVRPHAHELHVEKIGWREIILVLLSVALFAFLLPKLGLVISLAVLIAVAAIASHEFSLRDTLISMVVLIVLSYVVFVRGLELQFPVWPKFLTN
jgi:hypothetical protein